MLFEGTLRQNLDLQGLYSDEQLWQALENVCLREKFSDEHGLNSEVIQSKLIIFQIKDQGANLSAGEKQLLCIARAILSSNKIVLIDEATSNIDFVTESTILKTIKTQFQESTVITVAHRLKTIINCDR
jgi:ABC-type multidrug transport system fused ATPase/permease subunit